MNENIVCVQARYNKVDAWCPNNLRKATAKDELYSLTISPCEITLVPSNEAEWGAMVALPL